MKWLMLQPMIIDDESYISFAIDTMIVQPIGNPVKDGYMDPSTNMQWLDMSGFGSEIDVHSILGDAMDEDAVFHLYTYVYSPKKRGVTLRFAAGPTTTSADISHAVVYCNGSQVWSDYVVSPSNGTTNIPFNLNAGWNAIMIKAVVYDSASTDTIIKGDIVSPSGVQLTDLVYTTDPDETLYVPSSLVAPTPSGETDDFISSINSDPELLSLSKDINNMIGNDIVITPFTMLVAGVIIFVVLIIIVG